MREEEDIRKQITITYLQDKDLRDMKIRHLYNRYVNEGMNKTTAMSRAQLNTSQINTTQILFVPHNSDNMDVTDLVFDISRGRIHSFTVDLII